MTPALPQVLCALFAPLLFPDLHPVAVWLGVAIIAALALVFFKADDGLGDSESWIRADEARAILAMMEMERVG